MANRKASKAQADYEAYLDRAAEINRRIEAGETITEIMRSQHAERMRALQQRMLEQDRRDSEGD